MDSKLSVSGSLESAIIKPGRDPHSIRQLRLPGGFGRLWITKDPGKATLPSHLVFLSNLSANVFGKDGRLRESHDFGSGVVTTAGVNYMAADFLSASAARINAFNQHDSGTGVTAESVGQTALVAAAGPARVAGTQSNPTANVYRTVATVAYTATLAITEWGLFSAAAAGTMWDRRLFSAVNVANGDSIQYSYSLSINSGG